MFLLFFTLAIFSIVLYYAYTQLLYENLDNLLRSRAEGIGYSIDTYWENEKLNAMRLGAPAIIFSKLNNQDFLEIAKNWVEIKSKDSRWLNIVVQIFDAKGKLIVSSKDIPNIERLPDTIFKDILNGKALLYNIIITTKEKTTLEMRVFTMSVKENDRIAYVIQVAIPLRTLRASQNILKMLFLIILPCIVLLTGLVGAFLARQTLRPVNAIINSIDQITASDLSIKVSVPKTNDEIQRLAETFNELLTDLEDTLSSQKQLMQDISHELRTPLTILKGEIEVILKKQRTPEEYQQVCLSGLEEINTMTKLIENLLILAKYESLKILQEPKEIAIQDLLQKIVKDLRILAENKNIRIVLDELKPAKIIGNENQLFRLFSNIIDNAVKYTEPGGEIRISEVKYDKQVKILIQDTGIGIPEEALSHIFDRFYQSDKSRHHDGFGLGLSIARSIVQLHKGKIEISSEVHKGTTVCIWLPL